MNPPIRRHSFGIPSETLERLSATSKEVVERFLIHKAEQADLTVFPAKSLAAVLLLLYEQDGSIKVLLTTRSKNLRSHPGQTALPGGKYDTEDRDLIETAYREANEEVYLPMNCPSVHTLCMLRPYLSLHKLVVIPVVAFLSDLLVLDVLKPSSGEVDRIFDHPLKAILHPDSSSRLPLVPKGSEYWPYNTEYHDTTDTQWINGTSYRMHRFRSIASPIKGLTSDILILAAEVAFAGDAAYSRWAPGQPGTFAAIARILRDCDGQKEASPENSQVAG